MHRLRTVTNLDVSAVAGHHAMPAALLFILLLNILSILNFSCGVVGGVMVLGKLPVPGRPVNLDYSRSRASALAAGAGWGCFDIFLSSIISLLSPSLEDDPI